VKSVLDDIQPDFTKAQLIARMNADSEYREHLTGRLVGLLGIRNENIGSLKPSLRRIIDERFTVLYARELGTCTFQADKTEELVECIVEMKREIQLWEQELHRRQEELSR